MATKPKKKASGRRLSTALPKPTYAQVKASLGPFVTKAQLDAHFRKYGRGSALGGALLESIRPRCRVTIVNRFGQESTGRAVMRGPHGWVLNMGGKHGTPAVATDDNITAVRCGKR